MLQDDKQKLSQIIIELNAAFGTDFNDDDKVFLGRIKDNLIDNKDLQSKIEHNSRENVKIVFDKYFSEEMTKLLNSNMKFYTKLIDNEKLREKLKSDLFDLVYSQYLTLKGKDKTQKKEEKQDNG